MAIIAELTEPFVLDELDEFAPLPVGSLSEVFTVEAPLDGLSAPYIVTNRFPVPPTALAFLTDVDAFLENPFAYDALSPPYLLTGALYPESDYLEPTTGQIWPRIG